MPEPLTADIDVIILCGGLGTRLGSLAQGIPKPMVEINDRPFLDILIGHVASFGYKRFILCAGHKSEVIEDYYSRKNDGLTYAISKEIEPLGTAGAFKNAEKLIKSASVLGMNGDSFCRANLKDFLGFHFSRSARASIVLTSLEDSRDYGAITLNAQQEIIQFNEKHSAGQGSGLVNAGIYFMERNIIEQIPAGKKLSLEYDIFPSLVKKGFFGFTTTQRLFDIGTPERLEIAKNNL